MKTLYEILEVSETASKEIIEKAYKVLAKKYHPDLQTENDKLIAEEMMKKINEAYDVLSNDEKRKNYDNELATKRQQEKETQTTAKKEQNTAYSQQKSNNVPIDEYMNAKIEEEYRKKQEEMQENMQQQYQEQCQKAYENYLRSLGYRIKYKWTWKRVKELLKTCAIVVVIIAIVWLFPPTHKIIMEFYDSNEIVKTIVNIIGGVLVGIWNAICSIFKR